LRLVEIIVIANDIVGDIKFYKKIITIESSIDRSDVNTSLQRPEKIQTKLMLFLGQNGVNIESCEVYLLDKDGEYLSIDF
jgi:hypothetical protein